MHQLKVNEYSITEIVLSNNKIIKGSAILDDDGRIFPLSIGDSIENFLEKEENYKFLEMFKNKEIFLVGCGQNFIIPSIKIRKLVHNWGLKLEWVTTPMALQIFNMLIEDKRGCFALLINEI